LIVKRVSRLGLGTGLALGAVLLGTLSGPPVAAARLVSMDVCIVDRKPTSALAVPVGDIVQFELDLRAVGNTPYALKPGECVAIEGLDRDNEPGLRREFPQGAWLVEAYAISGPVDHTVRPRRSNNNDDDRGEK
jgi:hypothetical protein